MLPYGNRFSVRSLACAAVFLLGVVLQTSCLWAQTNEGCLTCHSDPAMSTTRNGAEVPLFVDESRLKGTAHGEFACVDCHVGFNASDIPHKPVIEPVDCTACHGDAADSHPVHADMIPQEESAAATSAACKDCHGSHVSKPTQNACGTCHPDTLQQFENSAHGRALALQVKGAPTCFTCHMVDVVNGRDGRTEAQLKLAQEKMCLSCHVDDPHVTGRTLPKAKFIAAYEKSVHGAALAKGNARAANCVDCHGSHEMEKGTSPSATINKAHIPDTCGKCHGEIARQYSHSIHGAAAAKGSSEAPVCTDCHGEHRILKHTDPNSPVAAANLSAKVCGACHSSVKLSEKYGIRSDRFQTFSDSYHGLAIRGGSVRAANCASCHGAHNILPASNPKSMISKANLPKTCGKCHAGANERFAMGSVHVSVTPKREPLLFIISAIYIVLIVAIIGGMLAHNSVDLIGKWRRHVRTHDLHGVYVRMSISERIQHALLMASFIALVITGFMLHYPDAWWVVGIRRLSSHVFDLRSLIHRAAAVVMVAAGFYHVYYVTFTERGRQLIRDLLPRRQDVYDTIDMIKYYLGRQKHKPRLGRFSYIEKSEYWALVWGTVVMTITGIILWMENTFIGLLTKLGWDVARTIHFYEAWLAALAIVVWHLYFVIFNPDIYPMNAAWITGTLPEDVVQEEHPLEYEQFREKLEEKRNKPKGGGDEQEQNPDLQDENDSQR